MRGTSLPSSVSVDDAEQAQLEEACRALAAAGETLVVRGLIADGVQSRVWRVSTSKSSADRELAVKCFRPTYRFTSAEAVAEEHAALVALHIALTASSPPGRVACPTPLRAWNWGYAMSVVGGSPLEEFLDAGEVRGARARALANDLVDSVVAFHRQHGEPFGDFHAGNVLVEPWRRVWLIDPSPANRGFFDWSSVAHPTPLAVDMAYWMYTTTTSGVRRSILSPRAVVRRCAFVAALLSFAETVEPERTTRDDVRRVLAVFRRRLATRGLRGHLVASMSRPLERLVFRMARDPR